MRYTFASELSHQMILNYYSAMDQLDEFVTHIWEERDRMQIVRNRDRAESWRIRLWCILNLNSPRHRSG